MKYYKNTELAKLYHVSEKSVRNWIAAAQEGKLDLQLYEEGDRLMIANTSQNSDLMNELAQRGKKYRNSRGYKVVTPLSKFYDIYGPKEIFDIISNLDIYREIPHPYSYFNGGATDWDLYVQKLAKEKTSNILSNTIHLLDASTAYLDDLLEGYGKVNVIDIGPGNAYPVRKLLSRFVDAGTLNRYIAIDTSKDMLDIAEKNVRGWFGDNLQCEGYVRDVNHERFEDLLAPNSFDKDMPVVNLVLFLGSTIANLRKPSQSLYAIHESMGKNDLLIFSRSLDTERVRRYFDFSTDTEDVSMRLSSQDKFALDLLNIDESLYEVEQFFDEKTMARRIQVRLKVALSIEFQLAGRAKVINFNKGEAILLWRHRHQNTTQIIKQFDENGFHLLEAMRSKDQECLLTISRIKTATPR